MARKNNAEVKRRAGKMSSAWEEDSAAAGTEFRGIERAAFNSKMDAGATLDNEIDDLEAQLKMKKDLRDDTYVELDVMIVNVRNGVTGDRSFGDDSPLYGAMGFVRKSERKSGLTRKKDDKNG